MEDFEKTISHWSLLLKKSTDFDSWGQLVEAEMEYKMLIKNIRNNIDKVDKKFQIKILQKSVLILQYRISVLKGEDDSVDLPLQDVKLLKPVLKNFIKILPHDFPASLEKIINSYGDELPTLLGNVDNALRERDNNFKKSSQKYSTLLPKLTPEAGKRYVSMKIIKIGLKDARQMIDPFIQVTCKDDLGVDICTSQSTPTPSVKNDNYLIFNVNVELQMPIEHMPEGSAVFFQLFHYKAKRRATKVKCFAFMEVDELKSGQCVIEIYKKNSSSLKRKKLELLTTRPLYLHLDLNVTQIS